MKYKVTQKEIKQNYNNKIDIRNCDLNLLNYFSPIAYTTRREGWGADIYEVNCDTVIITGYSTFGNIKPDFNVIERYNKKSLELRKECDFNWKKERGKAEEMLQEFVKEVTKK